MNTRLLLLLLGLCACGPKDEPPAPSPSASSLPEPPPPPAPEPDRWTHGLDVATSKLQWTAVKNGDTPVSGTLVIGQGALQVTPTDLSLTRATARVDLWTAQSGDPLRDGRLTKTFFEAGDQPTGSAAIRIREVVIEPKVLDLGQTGKGTAKFTVTLKQGQFDGSLPIHVERPDGERWHVTTTEPTPVSIAGMGLSARLAALVTECAHKSIDDGVLVGLDLWFVPLTATPPAPQ